MNLNSELPSSSQCQSLSSTPPSKISLTEQALKKLDPRNTPAIRRRRPQQSGRTRPPLTRRRLAELRRTEQSHSTPATEFLRACGRAVLSDIREVARDGGPDLLDIRGHSRPPQAPSSDTPPTTSMVGSYDSGFRQRMIDNGIVPDGYATSDGRDPPPPDNWNELQSMLAQRRPSLPTYSDEEFRAFSQADARSTSEGSVMKTVIPKIQGSGDTFFTEGPDIRFCKHADMMVGVSHKAKPDLFYGARPGQLHQDIRKELEEFVVPTLQGRPIAPNFFVEAKHERGIAAVALDQACFDGAVGARGMHSLQMYGGPETYDNKAYTLSATYHSGQLKIYSHHVGGPGPQPEYYMNLLGAWALVGNKENFIQGVAAFRNAARWTEAQRNAAINHANAAHRRDAGEAASDSTPPRLRPRPRARQR